MSSHHTEKGIFTDQDIPDGCSFCPALCKSLEYLESIEGMQKVKKAVLDASLDSDDVRGLITTPVAKILGVDPDSLGLQDSEDANITALDILGKELDDLTEAEIAAVEEILLMIDTCSGTLKLRGNDAEGNEYVATVCTSERLYKSNSGSAHPPVHLERFDSEGNRLDRQTLKDLFLTALRKNKNI